MIFQAFRVRDVTTRWPAKIYNDFIIKYPLFCVPCAPCRSSFSAAFEDVKKARKMGFVAAVRSFSPTNQF